jgi:hypothetical protein
MAVFFPTETDWGVAALGVSQVDDLPDSSWEGWELGRRRRLSAMFALTQPWAQRLRSAGCSGTRSSSCFMGCAVSVMPARIASHLFARSAAMIPSNPTLLHSALTHQPRKATADVDVRADRLRALQRLLRRIGRIGTEDNPAGTRDTSRRLDGRSGHNRGR